MTLAVPFSFMALFTALALFCAGEGLKSGAWFFGAGACMCFVAVMGAGLDVLK